MKKIHLTTLLVLCTLLGSAQTQIKLNIQHLLKGNAFEFNQASSNDIGHNFDVSRLEYYISGIKITHDGEKETTVPNPYILANAGSNDTFDLGSMDITNVEAISFSVGVDPAVNNGDPTMWPKNHPLYPKLPSMHWGWAAGYRFVAMEGKSGLDMNQNYAIHALGNENYFTIKIPLSSKDLDGFKLIELKADYSQALSGISVSSGLINHGAEGEAITLLRNFQVKVFTSLDGKTNVLSTENLQSDVKKMLVYPNPASLSEDVIVDLPKASNIRIYDLSGTTVFATDVAEKQSFAFTAPKSGVYFIEATNQNGETRRTKLLVH